MFDLRFGSLFLKLLLLAGLCLGGYEYFSRIENLKTGITEKKNLSEELKTTAENRSAQWQEFERLSNQINDLLKRETAALKQRDLIDQKERRLTGEIKFLAGSMQTAVEKARTAAVGTVVKELRINGRSALLNAKILKIEDSSITFLHEDGVANLRLQSDALPAELVTKYEMGALSLVKGLQQLEREISGETGSK